MKHPAWSTDFDYIIPVVTDSDCLNQVLSNHYKNNRRK